MTARRSSATERRGIADSWRAPAAVLLALAAASIALVASADPASRHASTGEPAATAFLANPPTNSTPHPSQAGTHPDKSEHPDPHPAGVVLTSPFTTASTSYPPPLPVYTDVPSAALALGADVLVKTPPLAASPTVNPADPRPRLEIISMPMWLWVNPVYESATATGTYNGTSQTVLVTVRTVVDSATWSNDLAAPNGNSVVCGAVAPATTLAGRGAGTPYASGMDPTNTTAVPRACITQAPTSPLYTTTSPLGGTPSLTGAVHYYTAAVMWHAEFEVTSTTDGSVLAAWATVAGAPGIPVAAPGTGQAPLAFRVGEIQALVTGP